MTIRNFLILILIFFIAGAVLFAQTINLEQARILALANSRSLASFEMSMRNSIIDERNQLYTMLPQISAGYSASFDFLRNWEFVSPIDTFQANLNFSITQVLFQGGKSFLQRTISSISTESVRRSALAEYFNVLDSIDNAYYAVLEATAALEAAESSLQSAELSLAIAEIRAQTGIINQGEYLRALAAKESQENSRNQARRNLTLNMTRFRNLTGARDQVFELEQINFDAYEELLHKLAGISDEEFERLYANFWSLIAVSNPSIARAALSSQRAELNLTNTKRDYAPTINMTVFSTGINYNTINGFNTTGSGGVTIRGTIPLDFWVMADRVEKSTIARDTALLDFINVESSLEQELLSTLSNLFTQAGSILSSRRSLEYNDRNHEFYMARYRLSQSSVSELNDASSSLIISRNNLNRASYDFLRSLSRLRSMCALDDEEKLIGILLKN